MDNTLAPDYYKEFSCIGSLCEDTCCAGWNVPIDKKTFKKYKKLPKKNKINSGVEKNLSSNTEADFGYVKMKGNSCTFLTEDKLCGVQLDLGEQYLSNTCSMYPRRFNSINNTVEKSMTVSCPEAARKILLNPEGIKFEKIKGDRTDNKLISSNIKTNIKSIYSWQDLFEEYRYSTVYILQKREYTIEERLILVGMLMQEIEENIDNQNIHKIPSFIGVFLNMVDSLEIKNDLNNIDKREDLQLKLFRELLVLRLSADISSKRYLECSSETQKGLLLENGVSEEVVIKNYKNKFNEIYKPFINKNSHILENYLVNYVFKNCFPIDAEKPYESFVKLTIHFLLIKNHLIGMGAFHNKIDENMTIKLIQSLSKTFEHNTFYFIDVLKKMRDLDMIKFQYVTLLIKN